MTNQEKQSPAPHLKVVQLIPHDNSWIHYVFDDGSVWEWCDGGWNFCLWQPATDSGETGQ